MMEGRGICYRDNGEYYEGEFSHHSYHGNGKYTWPDGDYYEGEYQKDERCGEGKFYMKGGIVYTGTFKEDKLNGQGFVQFPNGNVWSGLWKDDEPHGVGTSYFADGGVSKGEFKEEELYARRGNKISPTHSNAPDEIRSSEEKNYSKKRYGLEPSISPSSKRRKEQSEDPSASGDFQKISSSTSSASSKIPISNDDTNENDDTATECNSHTDRIISTSYVHPPQDIISELRRLFSEGKISEEMKHVLQSDVIDCQDGIMHSYNILYSTDRTEFEIDFLYQCDRRYKELAKKKEDGVSSFSSLEH